MAEFGLTEENFAMGWYNCGTGETRYFNENSYFIAGSMYKLPLCMNYVRAFADGSLDPETKSGGYTLTRSVDMAIRYSDNDAAARLRKYWSSDYTAYRHSLATYSDVAPETLPQSFINDNCFSPHIMLDTLKALYADPELYAQVIDNMLLAHPDHYFRKNQGEYEIAHKYGSFENALNDCGIIYTPTPFLLVAFTNRVWNAENILSTLVQRLTDYSLRLDLEAELAAAEKEKADAAPVTTPAPVETPLPTPTASPTFTPTPVEVPSDTESLTVPLVLASVLLISAITAVLIKRRLRKKIDHCK